MFSTLINKINTDANKNVLSFFDVILKKFAGEEKQDYDDMPELVEDSADTENVDTENENSAETENEDNENEDSDKTENDDSDDSVNEDSEESINESDSEEYEENEVIYLIQRSDKKCKYVKTYENAVKAMEKEVRFFLKNNLVSLFRMDKYENKIVIYERQPNSLNPFHETVMFEISIIRINKY